MISRFDGYLSWGGGGDPRDDRKAMIDETGAFLSWALSADADLPQIPKRRVEDGGFGFVSQNRGARALAERWWTRILEGTHFDRY